MTFNGVSLQQDLDAILVGSMQGFNMIWRNVTLAPLDLPPSTPTNTCRWAPFDSSQSSSRDSGGGSSATTRTLAVALSLGVAAPVLAAAACCFALLGRRRRRARALSLLPAVGSSGCAKSAEAEEGGAETIGQGQGPGGDRPGGVIQLLARYGPAILSTVSAHQGSATASSGRFGSSSGTAGAAAAAPTGAEAAAPTVAEAEQPVAPTPHPQAAAPAREPGATEPSGWKRLSSAIGALSLNLQERRLAASIAAAGSVAGGAALSQRRVATASPMPSGDLDAGSSVTSGPGGGGGGTVGQARSSRESGASGSAPSAPQLQLHEVLGRGTFGQVWRATWKGSTVAVKVRGQGRRGRGRPGFEGRLRVRGWLDLSDLWDEELRWFTQPSVLAPMTSPFAPCPCCPYLQPRALSTPSSALSLLCLSFSLPSLEPPPRS